MEILNDTKENKNMSDLQDSTEPEQKKARYEERAEVENPNVSLAEEIDFTKDDNAEGDNFMIDDKYTNFINPEDVEKLKEFKVLDEVKSNDEDSNDEESNTSDANSDGLPGEEIEKMLDEDLPEDFKGSPKQKEKPYITRTKIVLEEKGTNHFDILPLDWTMVRHCSGIPIYLHKSTRVCTLSKPYFLGKGNTRRHDIPVSAIPCFAYKRALEEEAKQKEIDRKIEEQIKNGTWVQEKGKPRVILNEKLIQKDNNVNIKDMNATNTNSEKSEHSLEVEAIVKSSTNNIMASNSSSDASIVSAKPECPMRPLTGNSDYVQLTNERLFTQGNEHNNASSETLEKNNSVNANDVQGISNDAIKVESSQKRNEEVERFGSEGVKDNPVPLSQMPVVLPGGIVMPPPRVESVNSSWKSQPLTPEQVNDYCKKLFRFKSVNIIHFKRWADRRKYTKARKRLQCPVVTEGTKLVTIPATNTGHENGGRPAKRDWVMNMNGRSYLSVFHEYAHRALEKQPVYEFKQLENASMPYQATVFIDGMQYGVGLGSSKRQAKSAAARASIHILIPEMKEHLEPNANADPDFTFFDYVGIEDPRIPELCSTACEPSPHAILRTCLLRNFGAADWHIHTEMKKLEFQKIELTMKVGKHTATVVCQNKKTAKQRAAQSILQALHPHVRSWGSLLRLYGSRSVKSCKEKKLEEQQITLLQDKARHNEPNYAVLNKLRHEMRKLMERDAAVVPIGTMLVPHALPSHSASNLNSVEF